MAESSILQLAITDAFKWRNSPESEIENVWNFS